MHRFNKYFKRPDERPLSDVPGLVITFLICFFSIQILWHAARPAVEAHATALPEPPSLQQLQLTGLGDDIALAKILMLWLQAFDNQPGLSIPFSQLDYDRLVLWLGKILMLDSRMQYPLLAASRLYSAVPYEVKTRKVLEFVYEQFFLDPNRRWPSLAHAVYVAKHRLGDLPLALQYARALAQHVTIENLPFWVKQMEIYVLEDMDEIESARIIIGGLLDSGVISDENELRFLQDRLKRLQENDK